MDALSVDARFAGTWAGHACARIVLAGIGACIVVVFVSVVADFSRCDGTITTNLEEVGCTIFVGVGCWRGQGILSTRTIGLDGQTIVWDTVLVGVGEFVFDAVFASVSVGVQVQVVGDAVGIGIDRERKCVTDAVFVGIGTGHEIGVFVIGNAVFVGVDGKIFATEFYFVGDTIVIIIYIIAVDDAVFVLIQTGTPTKNGGTCKVARAGVGAGEDA